jgi:N-acetylglutamate synthase-like GNAT family acetyltransferase
VSVQLQALADEVFDAAAALDLVVPPELRPIVSFGSEIQVAMVQAFTENPSPDGGGKGGGFTILPVRDAEGWAAFERLIHATGAEQGRTHEMITLFRWRAANTPGRFYLAYHGDRAVAHVGLFQHRSSGYLHALFTHPEYRQRGAGSFLTLAMGSAAHGMGCERVVLQCPRESGLPAYFKRLGFRSVGERQIWTKPQ